MLDVPDFKSCLRQKVRSLNNVTTPLFAVDGLHWVCYNIWSQSEVVEKKGTICPFWIFNYVLCMKMGVFICVDN